MTPESVVAKFIEKAGPLDPKPDKHFIQDANNGRYGLTTELNLNFELLMIQFEKDHNRKPSKFRVSPASKILPQLHIEAFGNSYDWDMQDMMKGMRILQNAPFSKIQVYHSLDPMPIAFVRQDCPVAVLLAPIVLPIKDNLVVYPFKRTNVWRDEKPEMNWIQRMPNSTYWLVEFPTFKGSWVAAAYGHPIGRLIKCENCKAEIDIKTFIHKLVDMNHPECVCSCDTYDDFCGCRRKRDQMTYDRIRRESTTTMHFYKKRFS